LRASLQFMSIVAGRQAETDPSMGSTS
jgi:hypothetical protein